MKQAELQQDAVLNITCLYLQHMCAWWLKPACCLAIGRQFVLDLHRSVSCACSCRQFSARCACC